MDFPMWRVRQMNLSSNVLLLAGAENRDQPALVLNESIDHPIVADLPFEADTRVCLCSATWEKGTAGLELAKAQDQPVGR